MARGSRNAIATSSRETGVAVETQVAADAEEKRQINVIRVCLWLNRSDGSFRTRLEIGNLGARAFVFAKTSADKASVSMSEIFRIPSADHTADAALCAISFRCNVMRLRLE
jgi:hypothetical protein